MSVSVGMKNHLKEGALYLCQLFRIEEPRREIPVNWSVSSRVNVAARGGTLKKNDGTDGTADAGAFSTQALTGDGYIEWRTELDGTTYCGLSHTNGGATAASIQFAIRVDSNGTVRVYESNTLKATSSTAARFNDSLRVQVRSSVVTYWLNRTLLYTSAATPTFNLFGDSSIATTNATINRAVLGKLPTVLTISNHTRRLTYNNEIYLPLPIGPTEWVMNEGFKADNAEVQAIISADGFTEADIVGGRWDGARVDAYTVNYTDLSLGYARHRVVYFGELSFGDYAFQPELRGLTQKMNQVIGDKSTALCLARFGSHRCGQPLDNYMHDGNATASSGLTVTIDLSPPKANNYFQNGLLYFRSGDNQFYEREIKSNVGNVLTLTRRFPLTIANGDDITAIAGCVKTRAACKTFVNADTPSGTNIENFQGTPDIPAEKVFQFPA